MRLFFNGEAIRSRLMETRPSLLPPPLKQFESNTLIEKNMYTCMFIYTVYMYLYITLIFSFICVFACMCM